MDKNEILAILKDWNDWEGQQDIGIIRSAYLNRFEALITGSNQIITITGPFEYRDEQKLAQLVPGLLWGHNILIMQKVKNMKEREYYITSSIKFGWSRNVLFNQYRLTLGNNEYFVDLIFST